MSQFFLDRGFHGLRCVWERWGGEFVEGWGGIPQCAWAVPLGQETQVEKQQEDDLDEVGQGCMRLHNPIWDSTLLHDTC